MHPWSSPHHHTVSDEDRVALQSLKFASPESAGASCVDGEGEISNGNGPGNWLEASVESLCVPLPAWAMRAGARETIYFNPAETTVAVVTCGGLCPGVVMRWECVCIMDMLMHEHLVHICTEIVHAYTQNHVCTGLNDVVQGLVKKCLDYGVPESNIMGIRCVDFFLCLHTYTHLHTYSQITQKPSTHTGMGIEGFMTKNTSPLPSHESTSRASS